MFSRLTAPEPSPVTSLLRASASERGVQVHHLGRPPLLQRATPRIPGLATHRPASRLRAALATVVVDTKARIGSNVRRRHPVLIGLFARSSSCAM
jgi:hypothetical protein